MIYSSELSVDASVSPSSSSVEAKLVLGVYRFGELIGVDISDSDVLSADSPLFALVDREALKMVLDSQSPWPWYGQLMARPQKIAYFLQIDFWLRHYGIELQF